MKVFVWCPDCAEFHECRHPTAEEDPGYSEAVRESLWVDECGHIIKVEAGVTNDPLSVPEEGFEEHCFCNRGLRQTPNEKKYCPIHGYEYQSSPTKMTESEN